MTASLWWRMNNSKYSVNSEITFARFLSQCLFLNFLNYTFLIVHCWIVSCSCYLLFTKLLLSAASFAWSSNVHSHIHFCWNDSHASCCKMVVLIQIPLPACVQQPVLTPQDFGIRIIRNQIKLVSGKFSYHLYLVVLVELSLTWRPLTFQSCK